MNKIIVPMFVVIVATMLFACANSSSDGDTTLTSSDTTEIPKIETVGQIIALEDSFGNMKLLGEVVNNGSVDATFVEVKCSFYDSASNLVNEDFSYIVGTNVQLVQTGIFTNTALKPSEKGAFKVLTNIKNSTVARYDCKYTYDIDETAEPNAKLTIQGNVNAQSNAFNQLELLGQVKNTGTKGLTFGQIYFVVRDKSAGILDLDFSYITGETVVLSTGGTTDTALSAGATGTFSASTSVSFTEYGSYEPKFDWTDANIVDGVATRTPSKAQFTPCCVAIDEHEKNMIRNRAIRQLQDSASKR